MANRMRSVGKERLWREQVSSWQRSGLTIREYCLQHQLSEPNFYAWRRELARRDELAGAPATPAPRTKPSSVTWMPVTVNSSTLGRSADETILVPTTDVWCSLPPASIGSTW